MKFPWHKKKMKTLVATLNYNLPTHTDTLVEMLNPSKHNDFDLAVIDNGSHKNKRSKYSTHFLEKNIFFGGGINYAFKLVLESEQYDSLLILNNDIILHGDEFVTALRKHMFDKDYAILSPCVLQPEAEQAYWHQMKNFGSSEIRNVKWVDFQAPMIHRKVIEKIGKYPDSLNLGYGVDILSGMICEDEGWSVGVCDFLPIIHFKSLTHKLCKTECPDIEHYRKDAIKQMEAFFKDNKMWKRYKNYRDIARKYKI